MLKKFANYVFSSNLNETATIDDLNYEYMKEYLVMTHAKSDIRSMAKLEMAKSMRLISESNYSGYRARNFAVLMFSEKPDRFIPNAHVKIIREVSGTDKMEAKVFDGPIWIQAKQVSKYFQDNIMASYTVRDSGTVEHRVIYNWPLATFEELATNCILHKEYESPNYIGIYIYDDKITFVNHNRPIPPVTIEALNTETSFDGRHYLNPELKDMFFALDLIESYGSGVRRAKEALKENGSPKLKFLPDNEEDDYTMAEVYINEEFAEIRNQEMQKLKGENGKTSVPENINARIYYFCKTPQKMETLVELSGYKDRKYVRKKVVSPLIEKGLLDRTLPDKPSSPKQKYSITKKCRTLISVCIQYQRLETEYGLKISEMQSDTIRLSKYLSFSMKDFEILEEYIKKICSLFCEIKLYDDVYTQIDFKLMGKLLKNIQVFLKTAKSCSKDVLEKTMEEFLDKNEDIILDVSQKEIEHIYDFLGIEKTDLGSLGD